MKLPRAIALMLTLACCPPQGSRADVVDGNLAAGGAYDTITGHPFGKTKLFTDLAVPFTPQDNDYWLDKVVVAVGKLASTTENRFAAHVRADAGGMPGVILETVVVRATSNWPGSLVSADFSGTTKLTRGSPYWVQLDKSHSPPYFNGGPFTWMYNSTGNHRSMMQSSDGGSGWSAILGGGACAAFQVEGTVLPQPEPPALHSHFALSDGVPNILVWQTDTDWSYDLFQSADLSEWTRVEGFPKLGSGGQMQHSFTAGMRGFFRISVEPVTP